MLVIDISVNRIELIEEIMIQRIAGDIGQMCKYRIARPEGFESELIDHHYNDGALELVWKALNIILRKGE